MPTFSRGAGIFTSQLLTRFCDDAVKLTQNGGIFPMKGLTFSVAYVHL